MQLLRSILKQLEIHLTMTKSTSCLYNKIVLFIQMYSLGLSISLTEVKVFYFEVHWGDFYTEVYRSGDMEQT